MKKKIKNIYKYLSLNNLMSTINNGIYMAEPNILNDPFEYDALKYAKYFKIGCLTSSFKDKKMWSIYGDRHKGCCVQLEVESINNIVGKIIDRVEYTSKVEKNRKKLDLMETKKYLFKKDKKGNIYFKCKIKKVYLGAKSQLCDNYLDILSKLKKTKLTIAKMYLSKKSYRILVNNDFCIVNEIRKILK